MAIIGPVLLFLWAGVEHLFNFFHRQAVQALSPTLVNRVVIVDPGHGGVDPGAVGQNNVLEKDLVLAVGHRLAFFLRQSGARVVLSREGDYDLADPEITGLYQRKRQDLARRVALANDLRADAFVSIHINSFPNPSRCGTQTFAQPDSPASQSLAACLQEELNRVAPHSRGVTLPGNYYLLRHARVPTVIVELGFITNPQEYRLLQDPLYQSKLAWSMYAGLVRYFAQCTENKN